MHFDLENSRLGEKKIGDTYLSFLAQRVEIAKKKEEGWKCRFYKQQSDPEIFCIGPKGEIIGPCPKVLREIEALTQELRSLQEAPEPAAQPKHEIETDIILHSEGEVLNPLTNKEHAQELEAHLESLDKSEGFKEYFLPEIEKGIKSAGLAILGGLPTFEAYQSKLAVFRSLKGLVTKIDQDKKRIKKTIERDGKDTKRKRGRKY